ncbi:MAG: serine/threonine-protein kinase [Streptosporangiaceae bacterium]
MDAPIPAEDFLRPGRYELQRVLRATPDKKVYLARDRELGCQVALDVFSNNAAMPTGLTVSAWETRVLGQLGDHRNIATVLDHWENDRTAVMVTRYLTGGSLGDLIVHSEESGERLPVGRILQIATEISSGLAHIHGRRILYRDLQPRNVLFDEWGTVHLVDFDTAVSVDDLDMGDMSHRAVIDYMAPELMDGGSADERADLYSLGATIYEMCQGRPPFAGTREAIVAACHAGLPSALERDDLPKDLRDLVFSLLAPERDRRPASAAEVVDRLERLRAHRTVLDPAAKLPSDESHSLPKPHPAELRASSRAKPAEYAVGDVIDDRFEILGELGRGGFSKVYHVRDDVEDEERALKLFDNAAGYEAVRREIGALRKIRHPNVVEVFWAGKTGAGDWFLVTEFIEGEPLAEFVSGEKFLRDREAVDVALDVLGALIAFHPDSARINQLDAKNREAELSEAELYEWMELKAKGLVHRDIKPQNVILTRCGAKLLDFNIVSRVGDEVKTQSGTPPYQSPDADLTRWDVSTDLFAVGVVLYQLLCNGRHPYPNSRPMVAEPVIDPRTVRSDLNSDLAAFLIKACAPIRVDRFSTAAEMQYALRKIRADL